MRWWPGGAAAHGTHEPGRVNIDAPVAAYLPGFTVADPAGARRITVRMLLNQTSGMADTGFPEMTLPQPATIADRVASLRTARLVSEPGTAWSPQSPSSPWACGP